MGRKWGASIHGKGPVMQDLQYIIGIGFSGADLPRAIILSFLFAMFAHKDTNIWKVGLLALLIDRILWPLGSMGATGADFQTLIASIVAMFTGFLDDLGIYIIRYLGITLMIGGFRWVRARIHHWAEKGKSKHAHA